MERFSELDRLLTNLVSTRIFNNRWFFSDQLYSDLGTEAQKCWATSGNMKQVKRHPARMGPRPELGSLGTNVASCGRSLTESFGARLEMVRRMKSCNVFFLICSKFLLGHALAKNYAYKTLTMGL